MDNATDLQSAHIGHKAAAAEGAQGRSGHMPSGLVVFIASCFLMRLYPQPFPIDIATTQALQNLLDVHWATTAFQFVGAVNDPGFAPLAVMLCFAVLFLEGLLFKEQGKSPIRWMVSATLLAGQTGQAREA